MENKRKITLNNLPGEAVADNNMLSEEPNAL